MLIYHRALMTMVSFQGSVPEWHRVIRKYEIAKVITLRKFRVHWDIRRSWTGFFLSGILESSEVDLKNNYCTRAIITRVN